ncbi:MAG: YfcE family phosphodiesterase [Nitrospira bacterium HGW-Nitrospira-1]|nr:MAG: YfcE family phosphodiesterase [Nitrospira bacterium HGW-Nitrospira-1]
MLIGIIADTHDNIITLKKAVDYFNAKGVRHVIHAGDFTSPFTFRILKELHSDFTGIFGNNDGDRLLLQKHSDGKILNQPHLLDLDNRKIIVIHEHHIVEALAESGHYDLVIYGHTHKPEIRKVKDALVINPGEAGGWLYGKPTVAVADLLKMTAKIVNL